MPSHPDRVRRNYHTIKLRTYDLVERDVHLITIEISRIELASVMSLAEVKRVIYNRIMEGITMQYK